MSGEVKQFVPVQEPIGDVEPLQEAAPKRRRGRPPRDPNAEPAPKRTYRKRGGGNLETRIGAFLIRVNVPFQIAASAFPNVVHPDDPLSAPETIALAKSLSAQANIHPTFRKYLETAMNVSDGADLIFVLGAIGLKRAANHGMVPEGVGVMASAALADPAALSAMFGGENGTTDIEPPIGMDRSFEGVSNG